MQHSQHKNSLWSEEQPFLRSLFKQSGVGVSGAPMKNITDVEFCHHHEITYDNYDNFNDIGEKGKQT